MGKRIISKILILAMVVSLISAFGFTSFAGGGGIAFDDRFGGGVTLNNYDSIYTKGEVPEQDCHAKDAGYTFGGWFTEIDGAGKELTGEPKDCTTYYAKWINAAGKTVRTTTLNIAGLDGANPMGAVKVGDVFTNEAEGWSWDRSEASKTLTIEGLTIDTKDNYAVKLPSGTVDVKGTNSVIGKNHGINAIGNATIKGNGTLNISETGEGTYGIVANGGVLTIDQATVNVSADTNGIISTNTYDSGENVIIKNGATVTTTLKDQTKGIGIQTQFGSINIKDSTVKTENGLYGIYSNKYVSSSNGVITVLNAKEKGIWGVKGNVTFKNESQVTIDGGIEGIRAGSAWSGAFYAIGSTVNIGQTTAVERVGIWTSNGTYFTNSTVNVNVGTDLMAKGIFANAQYVSVTDSKVNVSINNGVNKGLDQGDSANPAPTDTHQYAICAANGNVEVYGDDSVVKTKGGAIGIISKGDSWGDVEISAGKVEADAGLTGIWSLKNTNISGGEVIATASNQETTASTSSKAIYSNKGDIIVSGNAKVKATGTSLSKESYGLRAAAGNILVTKEDEDTEYKATVEAAGSTAAVSKLDEKSLTAKEYEVLAKENFDATGKEVSVTRDADGVFTSGLTAKYIKIYPVPKCKYIVALTEGEGQNLILGDKKAGKFDIVKTGCNSFQLKNEEGKYLYLSGDEVVLSNNEFTWKYDGGLYTERKTTKKTKFLFWTKKKTTTTKYYLSYDGEQFILSNDKVNAALQMIEANHSYTLKNNYDGTHTEICDNCKENGETAKHDFTYDKENHKCKCGAPDPEYYYVSDVDVTVSSKTVKTTKGFWFFKKTTTKTVYEYKITTETEGVDVAKIQYSGDGKTWETGSLFKSDVKVNELYIKVTDCNGNVTKWAYDGKNVKKYTNFKIHVQATGGLFSFEVKGGTTWAEFLADNPVIFEYEEEEETYQYHLKIEGNTIYLAEGNIDQNYLTYETYDAHGEKAGEKNLPTDEIEDGVVYNINYMN